MPRSHAPAPSFGTPRTPLPLLRLALLPALLLVASPLWAAARPHTLSWRHLDVEARLDADGVLHVRERHEMLLDGPWDLVERHFRLRLGEGLQLEHLARIAPKTGAERKLDRGDLDQVDHYAWIDGSTLRWRCRRASDPPFAGKVLTYVLDYTLTGVLAPTAKGFLLDRDFALPDRRWPIESFSLELTLDSPWRAIQPFPAYLEEHRLPPGRGVAVRLALLHLEGGWPRAVPRSLPLPLRAILLAAALLGAALLTRGFVRREARLGRFSPISPPGRPDRRWLEENLLRLRPEDAGAIWHGGVGPPEVAATLARMATEGKLASRVDRPGSSDRRCSLSLALKVDRHELAGPERKLVDALFSDGRTTIDTDAVRRHRRSRGGSLAAAIRTDLETRVHEHTTPEERPGAARRWRTPLLALGVLTGIGLEAATRGAPAVLLAVVLGAGAVPLFAVGLAGAHAWRKRVEHLRPSALALFVPWLLIAVIAAALLLGDLWLPSLAQVSPGLFGALALALLPLAAASGLLDGARSRRSAGNLHRRRRLAAARRYIRRELGRPDPDLEDAWLPYLVALDLTRYADRWSRSFGGVATGGGQEVSPAASSGGWSGGGETFGGAGGTSRWAAAAGALTATLDLGGRAGGGGE